jgi:hypothetical protein
MICHVGSRLNEVAKPRLHWILLGWILILGVWGCPGGGSGEKPPPEKVEESTDPVTPPEPPPGPKDGQPVEIRDPAGEVAGRYRNSAALVVGVSRYTGGWSDLAGIPEELDLVERILRWHGFEVEVVQDPSSPDDVQGAFEEFLGRHDRDAASRLVFFFAGHSHIPVGASGVYLLTADSPGPGEDTDAFARGALPRAQIVDWARRLRANHSLFLFDSCLPVLPDLLEAPQLTDPSTPISRDLMVRRVQHFITSCEAGQDRPRSRIFADTIVRALGGEADHNGDRYVTGTEFGDYVQRALGGAGVSSRYGKLSSAHYDLRGELVFALPSATPPALPPPPKPEGGDDEAWDEYLQKMEQQFKEVESLQLPADRMVEVWSDYLRAFEADDPNSERDDELREQARAQRSHWRQLVEQQGQASAPPGGGPKPSPPTGTATVTITTGTGAATPPTTGAKPTGAKPTGSKPTGSKPTGSKPTGAHTAGAPEGPLRVPDSQLLLKVVGLSDKISILESPGSAHSLATMEPLKPYFVLEDTGGYYRISTSQRESNVRLYVAKKEVAVWPTREGLRFIRSTFEQDRRAPVTAWSSEERIREYARTGDSKTYGPTFREEAQTRISEDQQGSLVPYPLLETKQIEIDGKQQPIHRVLIPAIVAVEVGMPSRQIQDVVGAVTFCVVFDATASMRDHAREFASTVESMLNETGVDTARATAGFVLFRDLKDDKPFETFERFQPMQLKQATKWLRGKMKDMTGGEDPAEPVLDAVMLAQRSFLWDTPPAIGGARRIMIVVANNDAKTRTMGLTRSIEEGLDATEVARTLLRSGTSVFALQAGKEEDGGHLIEVLSTLAKRTGGEFYGSDLRSNEIKADFSRNLRKFLREPIEAGSQKAESLASGVASLSGDRTLVPLDILDDETHDRLKKAAAEKYHVSTIGLVITEAWVFGKQEGDYREQELYREEILVEKDLLRGLIRFFDGLLGSSLDTKNMRESMAVLLEALIGEKPPEDAALQDLLEKRLGVHFSTNLLDFNLDRLVKMDSVKKSLLQEKIRTSNVALAGFYDENLKRFESEPRIWMPVSLLP